MELVNCAFVECGCNVKLRRIDMPLHEKDTGAHMLCLLGAFQTAKKKIIDLEEALSEQSQKIAAQDAVISRLDNPDSSQVILRVLASELHKKHFSSTGNISGCEFIVLLLPNRFSDGWHSLLVQLKKVSNLIRNARLEVILLKNSIPLKSRTISGETISGEPGNRQVLNVAKYMQTIDLQTFQASNGYITIKVNITLLY
jgi:hypothetical protein